MLYPLQSCCCSSASSNPPAWRTVHLTICGYEYCVVCPLNCIECAIGSSLVEDSLSVVLLPLRSTSSLAVWSEIICYCGSCWFLSGIVDHLPFDCSIIIQKNCDIFCHSFLLYWFFSYYLRRTILFKDKYT